MIVSIVGKIGSGKTYLSRRLVDALTSRGIVCEQRSWSSPLKDVVSIVFNLDRKKLNGITAEDRLWRETAIDELQWIGDGTTPRKLLQMVGTDLFRDRIHPDVWVRAVSDSSHEGKVLIFDDTRFINELQQSDISIYLEPRLETVDTHSSENTPEWKYDFIMKSGDDLTDILNMISRYMDHL